jgi:hypothetical protein
MLYLVEWDSLIVERTIMRDDDIESERSEPPYAVGATAWVRPWSVYRGTYEDDRDDVLGVAQFGGVPMDLDEPPSFYLGE